MEPGAGVAVVAVVGNEDVGSPVAVEVGDDDLARPLQPWERTLEDRARRIGEPTAPVAQEYDERVCVQCSPAMPCDEDVDESVPVEVGGVFRGTPLLAVRLQSGGLDVVFCPECWQREGVR